MNERKCFNPRSRTGNDCRGCLTLRRHPGFQSTFPHGERRDTPFVDVQRFVCFNPRSRTGNDGRVARGTVLPDKFQSTFPHGERQPAASRESIRDLFQSTFPHGERPESDPVGEGSVQVSIHVPARGTTPQRWRTQCRITCFNPRSRTGNDA